ncbi:MAG: hypothetical protein EHM64_10430 [Ignavibacteriae bacterium]|nr:MAG: hypothetical protein EHM64_10430 [Ignavibacteriota bacterium]
MDFLKDIAVPQSLEHFHLLVLVSTISALVFIPYVGFVAGSSILSLWYDRKGRREQNALFLQFAHDLIDGALFNKTLVAFLAVLPGLSLVFIYAQILQRTPSSGVSLAGFGFLFLVAGLVLLYSFKYTFRVQDILGSYQQLLKNQSRKQEFENAASYQKSNTQAHLRSGRYGTFFLLAAYILYSAAAGVTANPLLWDLDSSVELFISPDVWLKVIESVFISIGITGLGILYFTFSGKKQMDRTPDCSSLAKIIGTRFSIIGLLGLPITTLFNIAAISEQAATGPNYALASVAVIFFFLSAHFIYGYTKLLQPAALTAGFALFFIAAGALIVSSNLALGTAARQQLAVLAFAHDKSLEELKSSLGVIAVSFTGEEIYTTRCESCHLFDRKKVGPPYQETVPNYQGRKAELVSFILHPVKKNPDYPPMQNPGLKPAEADSVASYLLRRIAAAIPSGDKK